MNSTIISDEFNPQISVIIPTYNGSNYLEHAIQSVLNQTYTNYEIIVVDDGSEDDGKSLEIVSRYAKKIKYLKKKNGGVSSALNLGINNSSGEYISWLSHDDFYVPEKLELQVKYLSKISKEERKVTIVHTNYSMLYPDGSIVKNQVKFTNTYSFNGWLAENNSLHGCTLLIPKIAFQEFGGFSTLLKTTQDYDLWSKFSRGYKFILLDSYLVFGRVHDEQGSKKLNHIAKYEIDLFYFNIVNKLTKSDFNYENECQFFGKYLELYRYYSLNDYNQTCILLRRLLFRQFFELKFVEKIYSIPKIAKTLLILIDNYYKKISKVK